MKLVYNPIYHCQRCGLVLRRTQQEPLPLCCGVEMTCTAADSTVVPNGNGEAASHAAGQDPQHKTPMKE